MKLGEDIDLSSDDDEIPASINSREGTGTPLSVQEDRIRGRLESNGEQLEDDLPSIDGELAQKDGVDIESPAPIDEYREPNYLMNLELDEDLESQQTNQDRNVIESPAPLDEDQDLNDLMELLRGHGQSSEHRPQQYRSRMPSGSSDKSQELNVGFAPPSQNVQNRDSSEFGEELQKENDDVICLDIVNEGSAVTTNTNEGADISSADQDVQCREPSELRDEFQDRNKRCLKRKMESTDGPAAKKRRKMYTCADARAIFEKIGRDDGMMESVLQKEKEMEKEWEDYRRKLRAIMEEREEKELELDKLELEALYKAESVEMKIERAEKSLTEEKEGLRELQKELEELQKSNAEARAAELDMSTSNLNGSSTSQVIRPPQEAPEAVDVPLAPARRGPGRPKKDPVPQNVDTPGTVKRGRGRPRNEPVSEDDEAPEPVERRPVGRPKKIRAPLPADTQPVEPRPRGRPKKDAASSSSAVQVAPVQKGSRRSKRIQKLLD